MNKKISKYWLCQIGGWSTYIIVWTFFYLTLRTKEQPYFFEILFLDAILGVIITHLMRAFIQRMGFLKMQLDNQITCMFLTTVGFSFLFAFANIYLEDVFNLTSSELKKFG
jgi:hypothetical protein